ALPGGQAPPRHHQGLRKAPRVPGGHRRARARGGAPRLFPGRGGDHQPGHRRNGDGGAQEAGRGGLCALCLRLPPVPRHTDVHGRAFQAPPGRRGVIPTLPAPVDIPSTKKKEDTRMANELILAVDDEAHILELLSFNLEASGYRVVTAATGEDALVVCAHERPAMVLLDIMLPGIDGMEVCRRLKSAPTTADIPIIMLTAKGDEVDKILGLELGADDYITKPFSVRELIARVKALLRRAAPQNEEEGILH